MGKIAGSKKHLVHGSLNILKASRSIIMSLILNSNSFDFSRHVPLNNLSTNVVQASAGLMTSAVTTINLFNSRHTMMISLDIHQMRPDLKLKTLVIKTDELQSSSIQERLTFSQSRISELLTLATSKSDMVSPLLKSVSMVKIAMHRIRQ